MAQDSFLETQLEEQVGPVQQPPVLENEQFTDFLSRNKDVSAPDFTNDTSGAQYVHLGNMNEIKKQIGASMSRAGGNVGGDPQALFNSIARVPAYNSQTQTADVRDIYLEQLRKDPEAFAKSEAQQAATARAEQTQSTPEMLQLRDRLGEAGQEEFDQNLDRERLVETFPDLYKTPEQVAAEQAAPQIAQPGLDPLAEQEPVPAPEQTAMHAAGATPAVSGQVIDASVGEIGDAPAAADGKPVKGVAKDDIPPAKEDDSLSGIKGYDKIQRDIERGQRTSADEGERRSSSVKTDMLKAIRGRLKAGLINEAQAQTAIGAISKNPQYMTTNTTAGATLAETLGIDKKDRRGGNIKPADMLDQVNTTTRLEQDRVDAEGEGFETKVHTLEDGQKIIMIRTPGSRGYQLRNFKSDNKPGITEFAGGWYQTLKNGKTAMFDRLDGTMGDDGRFYSYPIDDEGNPKAEGFELPDGVSEMTEGGAATQQQATQPEDPTGALKWLSENPNDPQAAAVRAKLGI